jgi:hypothetical protein
MTILLIVTLISILLAAVMSGVAWRLAAAERTRSAARVEALAADIHAAAPIAVPMAARAGASRRAEVSFRPDLPRPAVIWERDLELRPAPQPFSTTTGPVLFEPRASRAGSRMIGILAGGALIAIVAATIVALSSGKFGGVRAGLIAHPATAASRTNEIPAPAPTVDLPVELVALGHERVGDELTVRGIVRNPASGPELKRLTAVVVLLTPDGGILEGGRHDVETALEPGGEARFVVTVPHAGDVGRYRVSFRTDDRIVSHVDRRHEQS